MAEVPVGVYEKAGEVVGSVRKAYPRSVSLGLVGPRYEYEFRAFFEDFGRSVTASLRCVGSSCESEVFVGWPPEEVRREFDAVAGAYPQCEALHERLIENGSVVVCREPMGEAVERLPELVADTVRMLRRVRR